MFPLIHPPAHGATSARRTIGLLAGILLSAACGNDPVATSTGTAAASMVRSPAATDRRSSNESHELATARSSTARFHRFAEAAPAGYTFLFMDMCMEDGGTDALGGMGYHYVNTALLDGHVDVATPEALLYEPGPNGQRRLVGVEYVIPNTAWTGPGAPMLFGQTFTLNAFGLWALHVWLWKDNPRGLYADWNPQVSCMHADAAARGAHH